MTTCRRNQAVKLRRDTTGLGEWLLLVEPFHLWMLSGNCEPVSVPSLVQHVAEANPDVVAMRQKDETGQWRQWTYQNLDEEVQIVAKALIEIGLHRHHSVAIMGSNSPHWIIANLAAISAG